MGKCLNNGASLRDRAGGPADLSRCASQPEALIPSAWHHEVVELVITSYRGSIGAEHYYGAFHVSAKDEAVTKPDGSVSYVSRLGYGVERHPLDNTKVERAIDTKEAIYLNKKDSDGFGPPPFPLKRGDMVTRFNDKQSIIDAAIAVFPTLFGPDDVLVIEDRRYIWAALVAPDEIATGLAANTEYAAQRQFLIDRGYLRKAQGTPTRSAETTGSVGEADGGPVAKPCAQPSPEASS